MTAHIYTNPEEYAAKLSSMEARDALAASGTFSTNLSGLPHLAIERLNNSTSRLSQSSAGMFGNRSVDHSQAVSSTGNSPKFR